MFSPINRRRREKSAGQQAMTHAVACVTEPLERRMLLSASYNLSALVTFNGTDGQHPGGGLIADSAGNLYGTTANGGTDYIAGNPSHQGFGTMFEIHAGTGALTTLVNFNSTDGSAPYGSLIADSAGNLYGTCSAGGADNDGTVFKIAAGTHVMTTLATFNNTNGEQPIGQLLLDGSGDLFGTTFGGGAHSDGTVFEVVAGSGTVTTLATFDGSNGINPASSLVEDSAGNMYGATFGGGADANGTIFKVAVGTHALTDLVTFNTFSANPSGYPVGDLIIDSSGDLFGRADHFGAHTYGDVFEVAAGSSVPTTLATFAGTNAPGTHTLGGLYADAAGNLYGTTYLGGADSLGSVFEVAAGTHALTTLASFDTSSGNHLQCSLFADANGNLFGTAADGGNVNGSGTVFELSQPPSISGAVFNDRSGSGVKTRRDNGLANVTVTLQKLKHGKPFGHSTTTITDAKGDYAFTGLGTNTYTVSESLPRGYSETAPAAGSYTVSLSAGEQSAGNDFGDHKGAKTDIALVQRASTPFAAASLSATPAETSALLFGSQDQKGVFAS
jgi:uncharacterized repeat protein (TIGR03803 family)